MKDSWRGARVLVVGMLACGLSLGVGCKKDEEGSDEGAAVEGEGDPAEETSEAEAPAEEDGEDPAPAEGDGEDPAPVDGEEGAAAKADAPDAGADGAVAEESFDESLFINAYFETTCVQAHIEELDKQKSIIEEVHARYGFDEAKYKRAKEALAEKDNVKFALKARMEKCNREVAEGLDKAGSTIMADSEEGADEEGADEEGADEEGADGEEQGEERAQKKPSRPARAYKPGSVKASVGGGGVTGGKLSMNLSRSGKVSGFMQGKREGKAFSVPIKGSVSSKTGKITAIGRQGANTNLRFQGSANRKGAVSGILQGKIHGKGYRSTVSAR